MEITNLGFFRKILPFLNYATWVKIVKIMERLCPYCKKVKQCTELDVGVLKATYRCHTCRGEFERDTYFKQTAGIGLSVAALFFGHDLLGGNDNNNNHNNNNS